MNIAVFTESPDTWDAAMDRFLDRVPAYIYMTSDGPYPVAPPGSGYTESQVVAYWFDQPSFEADGLMQETCRDLEHSGYGIASISHVAETALIQGIDLYETDVGARLRSAMEFHTPFGLGQEVPSWLCNGTLNLSLVNGMFCSNQAPSHHGIRTDERALPPCPAPPRQQSPRLPTALWRFARASACQTAERTRRSSGLAEHTRSL